MMGKRKERGSEEQEHQTKIWELLQLSGVRSIVDVSIP